MTKSVVISLIHFFCILWDLIVMNLVLSGKDLIKTVEGHMRSYTRSWKVNVFHNSSHELAKSWDD